MAKKKTSVPQYGTVMRSGIQYYRTRIMDADGKQVSLYATTCEELYQKEMEARQQVEDIIFRRKNPYIRRSGIPCGGPGDHGNHGPADLRLQGGRGAFHARQRHLPGGAGAAHARGLPGDG